MADECLTATAEATDIERRSLDSDVRVTGSVAAAEAATTGVAFVDMPTSVFEIADADGDDNDDDDKDDDEENDSLSYPGYVEKAFFYFLQTTRPRNWCLQLITWPYPLRTQSRSLPYILDLRPFSD